MWICKRRAIQSATLIVLSKRVYVISWQAVTRNDDESLIKIY